MTEELRYWVVPEINDNELMTIMKNLLVFLPDGVTVLDEAGRFLCLFGGRKDLEFLPSQYVLGRSVQDISTPKRAAQFLQTLRSALETNCKQSFEVEVVLQGTTKLMQLIFMPLPTMLKGKRVVGMYVQDRTEYHAIVGKLDELNRFAQQNNFFNMVFNGKNEPDHIVRELTRYGVNCEESYSCYYLLIDNKRIVANGSPIPYFRSVIIEHCMKKNIQWIWSDNEGFCMLIPGADPAKCRQDCETILQEIRLKVSCFEFFVGMACCPQNSSQQLTELPYNAYLAAIVAGIHGCSSCHYDEAGLYKFAFQLVDKGGHVALANSLLKPLIDFDLKHNVKLVDTLEYLLEHQNIKVVAGLMGLHPNTISWRKQKIINLLGSSLDDFTNNATLAMALKSWRIANFLAK